MQKWERFGALLASVSVLALTAGTAQAQNNAGSEEIVVTGSRLATRGGFTAPTPVTSMSSEAIEARAPNNIAQALYDLPSVQNIGTTKNTFGSTTVGTNLLSLRSLGATRTLTLVDGRRYVPMSTTTAFDTNLIPAGLVDRAEVVTGGASAAYGSDAVAGVVNIILKERLEGLHGYVQAGQTTQNDGENWSLGLNGGVSLSDKFHLIGGIEYSNEKGVGHNGVGPYARDWGTKEYGSVALATRPVGSPANVVAENVEFSRQTPGSIIIGGPLAGTAFGPGGVPFTLNPGPGSIYSATAGTLMSSTARANFGYFTQARQPLKAASDRLVALLRGTYEFTPDLELVAELNYGANEGHNNTAEPQIGPGGNMFTNGLIIAGPGFSAPGFAAGTLTSPFLPAATSAAMTATSQSTIAVGRVMPENGGFSTNNTSDTKQAMVALRGNVFEKWRWDAYASYGENTYTLDVPNVLINANLAAAVFPAVVNGQLVCGTPALNAVNPNLNALTRSQVQPGCVPFNIFGPNSESAAALAYVQNRMFYYIDTTQNVVAANIAGSPFATWAGDVSFATGLEYRKNTAEAVADRIGAINANTYGNYQAFAEQEIEVKEGYIEVGVPLARDVVLAKSLDFNAAVRRTDYSTSGGVTSWKVGLTYEPFDFLRLRATQSRDIRAANLGELYASTGGVAQSSNPFAVNQATITAPNQTVGNPTLSPEEADTFTGGFSLQPSFLPGFRFSADYYKIEINDVIATPALLFRQQQCFGDPSVRQSAAFCNAIFAGYDPTYTVNATGYTGVRQQQENLNRQVVEGVDFEAAYTVPSFGVPGQFDVRALASFLNDSETFAPTRNTLGVIIGEASNGDNAGSGTSPDWRYTFNVNYRLNRFTAFAQVVGFNDFKGNVNSIGPENPNYNTLINQTAAQATANGATALVNRTVNKNVYPAMAYLNLAMSYNLVDEGSRRLQLFANMDNVLDEDPPFGWVQTLQLYETIGASYKVGLRFDY